jgi:hypothetical protein
MWKQSFACAVLSAGIVVGVAVGGDQKKSDDKKGPSTTQSAMVNKFCAVMGEYEVDPEVFVMYTDKKVGFCCKDCIEPFEKDPKKYMKDLK